MRTEWTKQEEAELIRLRISQWQTLSEIATELGRSVFSVKARLAKLAVVQQRIKPWTLEEKLVAALHKPSVAAKMLNRTPRSCVYGRRSKI